MYGEVLCTSCDFSTCGKEVNEWIKERISFSDQLQMWLFFVLLDIHNYTFFWENTNIDSIKRHPSLLMALTIPYLPLLDFPLCLIQHDACANGFKAERSCLI